VCVCIDEIRREKRPKERERKRYIIRSSSQVNKGHNRFFFHFPSSSSSAGFLIQFIPKRNLTFLSRL
jgi:hypothetical protein